MFRKFLVLLLAGSSVLAGTLSQGDADNLQFCCNRIVDDIESVLKVELEALKNTPRPITATNAARIVLQNKMKDTVKEYSNIVTGEKIEKFPESDQKTAVKGTNVLAKEVEDKVNEFFNSVHDKKADVEAKFEEFKEEVKKSLTNLMTANSLTYKAGLDRKMDQKQADELIKNVRKQVIAIVSRVSDGISKLSDITGDLTSNTDAQTFKTNVQSDIKKLQTEDLSDKNIFSDPTEEIKEKNDLKALGNDIIDILENYLKAEGNTATNLTALKTAIEGFKKTSEDRLKAYVVARDLKYTPESDRIWPLVIGFVAVGSLLIIAMIVLCFWRRKQMANTKI